MKQGPVMDDEVEAPIDALDIDDADDEEEALQARSSSGHSIAGSIAGSDVT